MKFLIIEKFSYRGSHIEKPCFKYCYIFGTLYSQNGL